MVFINIIIRFRAPVFSIYAICKREVATIKETGKDLIKPVTVERRITSGDVLKNKNARMEMNNHPAVPLISAGFFQIISIHRISTIGKKVKRRDGIDHILRYPQKFFLSSKDYLLILSDIMKKRKYFFSFFMNFYQ
jgi:hypothetical protein